MDAKKSGVMKDLDDYATAEGAAAGAAVGEKKDSSDEYEIEKIRGKKIKSGIVSYLIKWKGAPEDQTTWEVQGDLERSFERDTFDAYKAKWESSKVGKKRTSSYCITDDDVVDGIMDVKKMRKTLYYKVQCSGSVGSRPKWIRCDKLSAAIKVEYGEQCEVASKASNRGLINRKPLVASVKQKKSNLDLLVTLNRDVLEANIVKGQRMYKDLQKTVVLAKGQLDLLAHFLGELVEAVQ